MDDTLHTIFWAIVVLGVLIFAHELGHFLAARWFGVRVLVFSLGFGHPLFGWKSEKSGTEYILSAIPLGGYVKMLGESDEEDEEEEPLSEADKPFAFSSQPVFPRFAIVFAGPLFNFLFAVVVLSWMFWVGVEVPLPVVGQVQSGMPAAAAGVLPGDRITMIDDLPISRWELLSQTIRSSEGKTLTLTIERDGKQRQIRVTPQVTEIPNPFGEPTKQALIGVVPGTEKEVVRYSLAESLVNGWGKSWEIAEATVMTFWKLISRSVSADQVGGPLLIAQMAGKSAAMGLSALLYFMGLISINLGILNLLPIPILDGGHLLFFTIEAVKGSPLHEKARLLSMRVGIALLSALMLLAFYNDLVRIFFSPH